MTREQIMARQDSEERSYLALNIFCAIGNVFMFLVGPRSLRKAGKR